MIERDAKPGTRDLRADDAKSLAPGAQHYTAYVGPPSQYDFMGATQFRLLCALGLRDRHRLLDFGCGSLRAGRLLIPYLDPGHYFGLEPNRWLVEDAVEREIGADMVRIKRPTFLHHGSLGCREFGVRFDYVLAQSIFSHCGLALVDRILAELAACMADDGIAAVTFVHAEADAPDHDGQGWVYPGSVAYRPETVARAIGRAGLHGRAIPWYHPRQVWYVLSRSPQRIPGDADLPHLRGVVLFDPEFRESRARVTG
jgi:hypothetical protein